jgi:hypothetical protein
MRRRGLGPTNGEHEAEQAILAAGWFAAEPFRRALLRPRIDRRDDGRASVMRVKIFSCHHVAPSHLYDGRLFQDIGSNFRDQTGILSDLDGINIAGDNDFSEMRHQFYVWKNLLGQYDHVGFEHYRRVMFIDPLPVEQMAGREDMVLRMRQIVQATDTWYYPTDAACFDAYVQMRDRLDDTAIEDVRNWISNYDIITVRSCRLPVQSQWCHGHGPDAWPVIEHCIRTSRFFGGQQFFVDLQTTQNHLCNVYIMSSAIFDEYMHFSFEVMFRMREVGAKTQDRMWGYVSERLFSYYLLQSRIARPSLRVATLPMLERRDT